MPGKSGIRRRLGNFFWCKKGKEILFGIPYLLMYRTLPFFEAFKRSGNVRFIHCLNTVVFYLLRATVDICCEHPTALRSADITTRLFSQTQVYLRLLYFKPFDNLALIVYFGSLSSLVIQTGVIRLDYICHLKSEPR